jgi:hypothetical protein
VSDDPFETVAIAYRPAQVMILLSLFEWYGVPAYAQNYGHASVNWPITLALGGIPIRVARDFADEARALLSEVADDYAEAPAKPQPLSYRIFKVAVFFFLFLPVPPPRRSAVIVG